MTTIDIDYKNAKQKLLTNFDENCQQFFVKHAYLLEYGYSKLIEEKLNDAKEVFASIKDRDIRAHWALCLISLIEDNIKEYPTYLQLRNFFEIDLNLLLHYYKGNYVENILRYCDFLYTINPELYKFAGRVLYNNNYFEQAMFFLKRAKDYFYNDPELHYLLAFIYFNNRDFINAKKSVNDCLNILPEYFPAEHLQKILKNV